MFTNTTDAKTRTLDEPLESVLQPLLDVTQTLQSPTQLQYLSLSGVKRPDDGGVQSTEEYLNQSEGVVHRLVC